MKAGLRNWSLLIIGFLVIFPRPGLSSGFMLYEQGGAAHGMADVRTAIADDPSAVFFNPAAICELPGVQVQFGGMGILPYTKYKAAGAPDDPRYYPGYENGEYVNVPINDGQNSVDAKLRGFTPVYLYATWNLFDWGVSVGYGLNSPYGLGIFWPGDWDGRFIATESDLATFMNNAVVAVDLAHILGFKDKFKLSIAAGYVLLYGQARMSQHLDLRLAEALSMGSIRDPWGVLTLEGDGLAHGFNVALYAEIPDQIAFGLSFRSGMVLPLSGDARVWFNPAGELAREQLGLQMPDNGRTKGGVDINLPMHINAGLVYLGVPNLKVGLDLYYAFYESYEELAFTFSCADDGSCADLATEPLVADWNNSYMLAVGAEYVLFDFLPVRLGYAYITSPVPGDTLDPTLPDGQRDQFSLGCGYLGQTFKVDLAYSLITWKAIKSNDVGDWDDAGLMPNGKANGTYTTVTHMLGLSYTHMF